MIPSFVKRISKSLSFRGAADQGNSSSNDATAGTLAQPTRDSTDLTIGSLRRQSTKELVSEEESSSRGRVTSRSNVTSVRTSSVVKVMSKSSVTSQASMRQLSKRSSKAPSRLVEEGDVSQQREASMTKTTSKSTVRSVSKQPSQTRQPSLTRTSSKTGSIQKSPSRQGSLSRTPSRSHSLSKTPSRQGSLTKTLSKQGSLSKRPSQQGIRSKTPSLSKSGSQTSMKQRVSVKAPPAKTAKPGGKQVWFPAGSYLTVRSEENGFYLCRALNNIYNTTKSAKIRWLGPKTGKRKKRGKRTQSIPTTVDEDAYELVYQDELDPSSILMEVAVERKGESFFLDDEDKQETERLLQVAEDVEMGKMDKADIGEDVEEVVLVDYEPPAKRRKLQSGTPKEPKVKAVRVKKPRLIKTSSQKERDKAQKAKEREEKKQKRKEAAQARKRAPSKKEDLTLHPNPSVKILDKDPLWETNARMPYVSKYANCKLVFRAVQLNDMKMLKKLLKDPEKIFSVNNWRCVMLKETPLLFAIKEGNKEAIELLGEDLWGQKFKGRFQESHPDRVLLNKLDTGSYNFRSLGVWRIRPLMASRGAREGNNALTKDGQDLGESDKSVHAVNFFPEALLNGASKEFLFKLMNNWKDLKPGADLYYYPFVNAFLRNLPLMLARGFNETAGEILKLMQSGGSTHRMPSFTWKVLVAKDVSELPSIPPSSIDLNLRVIKGFNMIHVAASNPNTDVLEKVLNTDPNFLVSDVKGLRPIHIAAGCASSAPLQLLLDRGASPFDASKDGETALHFAIQAGRTKNVEILLKLMTDPNSSFVDPTAGRPNGGVNRSNKKSLSPLHLACLEKDLDMVELLVNYGANLEVKTSLNDLSVTPLMFAAGAGDLGIVQCLVNAGAAVERPDRVGRTALMHAAMNGATSVMSYLLNIGASPNRKDTSGNSPLHYAAAYGWYFSVKLLLQSGADPATSNDWATTPLSVAYLKGHQGIVSLLLEDDRVDVNFPNQDGETLLFIACSSAMEKDLLEQIRYLVEKKGAKCCLVDNNGNTPLHIVAKECVYTENTYEKDGQLYHTQWKVDEEANKVVLDIAKMMVKQGCDLTLRNKEGYTPAMTALTVGNVALAQYLVENGSPIFSSLVASRDTGPNTLLHELAKKILNHRCCYINSAFTFLTKTWSVKGEKKSFMQELREMAQTYDCNGNTPLLAACHAFYRGSYSEIQYMQELENACWENAQNFLKNLVHVAKSDINATNRPTWRAFGARQGEETNMQDYQNPSLAKRSPVFFMVEAKDPFIDKNKKADVDVKGTTLKYFLSQGAKVNVYDLGGNTPLTVALEKNRDIQILQILIKEGGADVNMSKKKTVTVDQKPVVYQVPPICLAAQLGLYDKVTELLTHGANVNAVNEEDKTTVLHKLANRRQTHGHSGSICPLLEQLLKAGVDTDAQNKDKRTALHLLVSNNPGRINDSFEEEMLLISNKADLTIADNLGRIPLHYLFVKISRDNDTSQCDPVDLCKLLVKSMKPAALNTHDMHGRTPLHYAARRGASICCMYLMQKSAKQNVKDNDGNTPLALAVMCRHDSCGSILVQHDADLLSPVVLQQNQAKREEKDLLPEWKWKPLTFSKTPEGETKVHLFQEAIKQGLVGVSFLILEWPVEKSGITLVDAIEMAVKNSQFNVALRMLSTVIKGSQEVRAVREQNRNLLHVLALHATPDRDTHEQEMLVKTLLDKGVKVDAKDKYNCTPLFYAAYKKNWKLVEILAAVPGVLNVKDVDSFNRNLIAASLWNCFFTRLPQELWDWLEGLLKKKADINKKFEFPLLTDVFGTEYIRQGALESPDFLKNYPGQQVTPFIFVLHCKDFIFTHNFLQWGANPNLPDSGSLTPLMHAVKLNSVQHVKQLLKYDYDPDVDDKDPVKPPPKKKARPAQKRNVFRLKKVASDASKSESDSSKSSDEEEASEDASEEPHVPKEKVFKAVKKTSTVNLNATDNQGWTALHYAARSLNLGAFDNDELVFVLGKAGAKLGVKNSDGETPLDIALRSSAPKVAAMLQTLMGVDKKHQKQPVPTVKDHRAKDGVMKLPDYDFHADAEKQLGGGEEEMEDDQPYEADVSEHCQVSSTIVRDEDQDLPYEVLMTKCDSHQKIWGMYNFYQIQLVHQTGQNIYVLFTRWGRIGDEGQYQHTPFQERADAVKEFCKIFHEKSGNKWEDVKNFEQKPKKYRLVPAEYRRPPAPQKELKFDLSTTVKSTLPDNLLKAMKVMVDLEKMQNSYSRSSNIDSNILPFGSFSRKRLLKAKELLDEIGPVVHRIEEYIGKRQEKTAQEKEQFQADCEKVSKLSSDYFQLIPRKNYAYERLEPLHRSRAYHTECQLITNLLDFEVSTKMMLGAMFRKTVVHPLDYIYSCLKCKLELMDQEDPMTQYILRYAFSTSQRSRACIEGIYKVEREGEEARFQKCGINNRRLLWHGTRVGNITSILNRGLVAAPLDAVRAGDRFGKGIYFSNIFNKSDNYSDASRDSSGFMLLCEVALGKELRLYQNSNEDDAKKTAAHNSTVVEGYSFPDPEYDVRLPSGEIIPLGDLITETFVTTASGERVYKRTDCTEYIVGQESQVCIRYLVQYRKH